MKRFYNYTFRTVCVFIMLMTSYSVTIIKVVTKRNYANNANNEKIVSSVLLAKDTNESIKVSEEVNSQRVEVTKPTPTPISRYNPIDTSQHNVISRETVNISHFGPDCNGCGAGYVASGYFVGNGNIYYNDPTYGTVRIVAADYKYPLGTIVRLNHNGNVIIAIVLDRGGGIGDGKRYQIDLLAESEAQSSALGVMWNASLEVLRLGY